MTDDINDPIAALRMELASVAPSPGFTERVRGRLADDLEPLRAELTDLAVSSDFAVRVRQSLEAGGDRRGLSWPLSNWRFVIPAAGIAAAVIALIYFRPGEAPAAVQIATAPAVTPIVETPTVAAIAPPRESRPEVARVARLTTRDAAPVPETRDPMLEVITDQPAILKALWVRVVPGVTVDSTEPAGLYQAPKLEVAPIEVSPISRFVVPDTRAPIGITPFILRFASVGTPGPHLVTAESAERSSR